MIENNLYLCEMGNVRIQTYRTLSAGVVIEIAVRDYRLTVRPDELDDLMVLLEDVRANVADSRD